MSAATTDDPRFLNNLLQQLELLRFDYSVLPLRKSIDEYVRTGIPRGDFLTALLANDLRHAAHHADATNRWLLPIYVAYVDQVVPEAAKGGYERIAAYILSKREARTSSAVARHGGKPELPDAPFTPTRTPKS